MLTLQKGFSLLSLLQLNTSIMITKTKLIQIPKCNCPSCNSSMKFLFELKTEWYGELKYFMCKICKENFIERDSGDVANTIRR